jgi:transposase
VTGVHGGTVAEVVTEARTVLCPHCGKTFHADLLAPDTERAGFKCPHCRLFVARDRAEDTEPASAATT